MSGNPLFGAMGGGQPNFMQMLQQFRQNPAQMIMQSRYKIPQNLMQDPNAMLQHLVKTGQVSQQQINNAYQMVGQFKK